MLKFIGPLIAVEDIAISRRFYEQLLGLKVQYDFGVNVSFEGNLAIHLKSHFQMLLGDAVKVPISHKAHNGELYLETDALDTIYARLHEAGVDFIHAIQEQPWGSRVLRCYDPDGHVLEIGETMEETVRRMAQQGMSIDQVTQKTGMPREFVAGVANE